MTVFRTNPLTGQTIISKDNAVQKDGFTGRERAGEYGTRKPQPPKKTDKVEGDPEEAKKFMRAAGLHGLADMYETNGNAAKDGKIPPIFANNKFFAGVKLVPEGQSADSKDSATVGDTGPTPQDFIDAMKEKPMATNHVAEMMEKKKEEPGSLPMPNILHDFASYNNLFSFGCLSAEELNFPDRTYRKNGIKDMQYVLRSAGGLTADQKPRTSAEQQYGIDTEYYIDSVNLEEAITPNRKSRHTNFYQMDFVVREPYSMGQFLETLYRTAKNAGYNNYLEAPWLMQINFVGHQDVERTRPAIAASKKQLCIKIVNIVFDVDTEGSIYTVTATPFNESIFSDQIQSLPIDISVSGDDLAEMCQSGVNSVTTHINTHLLEAQKDEKEKIETDEYIIAFPNEVSSKSLAEKLKGNNESSQALTGDYVLKTINYGEAFQSAGTNLEAAGFTQARVPNHIAGSVGEQQISFVNNRLGFSIKRGELSESIKTAISSAENGVSAIGRQKIRPEAPLSAGDAPFSGGSFILNEETDTFSRGGTTINPKQRTIQFRKGTKIQRVIEELVLLSDFGQRLLKKNFEGAGKVSWFRIESSCYIKQDAKTEAVLGRMPKIFVYRVVPYDVNTSFFQMPNDAPPGYEQLVKEAPKAYNYMYTGRNTDILEFSIKFDNAFYKAVAMDMGNRSANNRPGDQDSTKKGTTAQLRGDVAAQQDSFGEIATVGKNLGAAPDQISGGAMTETPEIKIARMFNESLVNSDVDLVTLNLKILGDPFYISDSGVGNYVSERSVYANVKEDGTIDHQSGKVDILLNFQTPIDINDATGGYKMNGPSVGVSNFNGLYFVTIVRSRFEGNIFTQELELVKRANWKKKYISETNQEAVIEAKKKRTLELKKLEDLYGEESDVYRFAKAQDLADKSGLDAFSVAEINAAGFTRAEADRLQTAWKKRKPPPAKTAAEIAATDYAGGDAGGEFGATPTSPTYDDAILRQNRANKTTDAGNT